MIEYEDIFRRKEISDMYATNEPFPLDDIYDIEGTALTINSLNRKLDFYKEYKKRKVEQINDEMKVVQNKINFLKAVIVATLKKFNEKSTNFPGSCEVISRKQKEKWVIKDEEEFIKIIEESVDLGDDVDGVIKTVTSKSIVKKEADKLLNSWEKNGKLEEIFEKIKDKDEYFVQKEPSRVSVTLKFDKDIEAQEKDYFDNDDNVDTKQEEEEIPKKGKPVYDSI